MSIGQRGHRFGQGLGSGPCCAKAAGGLPGAARCGLVPQSGSSGAPRRRREQLAAQPTFLAPRPKRRWRRGRAGHGAGHLLRLSKLVGNGRATQKRRGHRLGVRRTKSSSWSSSSAHSAGHSLEAMVYGHILWATFCGPLAGKRCRPSARERTPPSVLRAANLSPRAIPLAADMGCDAGRSQRFCPGTHSTSPLPRSLT